jgi:putative PIN family toxin of toxin-antitoxin system
MLKNKPLKLIIDTDLWVSFIISNKQNLLDSLLFSEEIRLLFSKELITEILQTITKPKLKIYFRTNCS